jgi:hypothetical protein
MEDGLFDEFPPLLTPVAVGEGQHLLKDIDTAPSLNLQTFSPDSQILSRRIAS